MLDRVDTLVNLRHLIIYLIALCLISLSKCFVFHCYELTPLLVEILDLFSELVSLLASVVWVGLLFENLNNYFHRC